MLSSIVSSTDCKLNIFGKPVVSAFNSLQLPSPCSARLPAPHEASVFRDTRCLPSDMPGMMSLLSAAAAAAGAAAAGAAILLVAPLMFVKLVCFKPLLHMQLLWL